MEGRAARYLSRVVNRTPPLAREAALSAVAAASLAAMLAWLGPPAGDLAAHAYQRTLFLDHGFTLWDNFWYAGRYNFITYSVLYYPLAALLGIKPLAVASLAGAALAFAVVVGREWGPPARWSSRTFALVWPGIVLMATFPFALGAVLALLGLWALQRRAHGRFALLAALTLAASPVAFLLLALLLGGVAIARRARGKGLAWPALTIAAAGGIELVLWRLFPGGGRYPFSFTELIPALIFCGLGTVLTWRVERAQLLRFFFVIYGAACVAAYLVPSALGENVARVRFAAIPLTVLGLTLRHWRPRLVSLVALGLAVSWNVTPIAASFVKGSQDPAASVAYWRPAIAFLQAHLTPSYRVETVDTVGHWEAVYLPRAGISIARGWFRQDDFPQNKVLYGPLGRRAYLAWLRGLGVRYVVLTQAPTEYSARGEAALLLSGHSGLRPVFRARNLTMFEVPRRRPLVTGPARARVLSLTQTRLILDLARRGRYRVAVRYSPYWRASVGCVSQGQDGMIRLRVPSASFVELDFHLDAGRALDTLAGKRGQECASS